ncbi:MAG: cytochrome c biogenesis protein CcdA [Deltaproteobacteria bacterium]|nr:cytochrome c biogenesis protein CcdA [Deltaproteobacteria bacterium]
MKMNRASSLVVVVAALSVVSVLVGADVAHADALLKDCPDVSAVAAVVDDSSLSGQLKTALGAGNLMVAIALVLLGGLLTALSPCVYPLIPITLSILGARQAGSPFKGFLLAATYVSGMVVLYTTLGVSFAWAGALAGSALQSPWITVGVALFCVAMAASMFGAFELVLPSSLQTKLSQAGGGGFKGAFIMGLVAGIIAAPCTGPVLSFILTLIARERDLVKGATLMFFYALGMGLPFLVLGTFSQAIARMPKSGKWMETIKSIFGLLMLGAGLYYLQIGVPAVAELLAPLGKHGLWLGPVLLACGVAIGALRLSFKYTPTSEKARKGAGVAIATLGILAFLAWTNAPAEQPKSDASALPHPEIAWVHVGAEESATSTFEAALAQAKADCKPVMIDFGADWCIACKELDKLTYVDAAVQHEALRFVNIKIDATSDTPALNALQAKYGVVGLPTIVFLSSAAMRSANAPAVEPITGFLKADEYLVKMKQVR